MATCSMHNCFALLDPEHEQQLYHAWPSMYLFTAVKSSTLGFVLCRCSAAPPSFGLLNHLGKKLQSKREVFIECSWSGL